MNVPVPCLELLALADAASLRRQRQWLVEDLLAAGELSVWYGQPKSGKTFLLLHIAHALAQGRPVFGHATKQAAVLYLALENAGQFAKRLEATLDRHGDTANFLWSPGPALLTADPRPWIEAMVAALEQVRTRAGEPARPLLLVIDTLFRVAANGDIREPQVMATIVQALDRVRERTGVHIALLHHAAKGELADTPFGSQVLQAALDLGVQIRKREGRHVARIVAARDGEEGIELPFSLQVVELAPGPDGEKAVTCLVVEDGAKAGRRRAGAQLTANHARLLRELRACFKHHASDLVELAPGKGQRAVPCIGRRLLRDHLRKAGWFGAASDAGGLRDPHADTLTARDRQRLQEGLKALKYRGFLGFSGDFVWLLPGKDGLA